MLICKKHRFIFVHIYKNAGTSITAALKPVVMPRWQWWINWELKRRGLLPARFDTQPCAPHATAAQMIAQLGAETFASHFSFAIVRNPWDWQVSLYKFVLKDTTHRQHELIKGLGSFSAYVRWRCSSAVVLQRDFVYAPDGRQLVSFIGRYENLAKDFATICSRIGVRVDLPHLNVSNTKPYREFYDAETRRLIAEAFRADIELFGYEF